MTLLWHWLSSADLFFLTWHRSDLVIFLNLIHTVSDLEVQTGFYVAFGLCLWAECVVISQHATCRDLIFSGCVLGWRFKIEGSVCAISTQMEQSYSVSLFTGYRSKKKWNNRACDVNLAYNRRSILTFMYSFLRYPNKKSSNLSFRPRPLHYPNHVAVVKLGLLASQDFPAEFLSEIRNLDISIFFPLDWLPEKIFLSFNHLNIWRAELPIRYSRELWWAQQHIS